MGRSSGTLWPSDHLLQPFRAMAKGRCLGPASRSRVRGLRWRHRHDRLLVCPRSPARGHGKKGGREDGGMGRSRGGLTSKIHALVDAEGRPAILRLTGGQVADCREAEALLDALGEGDILLADKGYDSDAIRAWAKERKAWATSRPSQTARAPSPSPRGSTASETSWSASSTASDTSAASQRATTRMMVSRELPRSHQARLNPHLVPSIMSLRPRFRSAGRSLRGAGRNRHTGYLGYAGRYRRAFRLDRPPTERRHPTCRLSQLRGLAHPGPHRRVTVAKSLWRRDWVNKPITPPILLQPPRVRGWPRKGPTYAAVRQPRHRAERGRPGGIEPGTLPRPRRNPSLRAAPARCGS